MSYGTQGLGRARGRRMAVYPAQYSLGNAGGTAGDYDWITTDSQVALHLRGEDGNGNDPTDSGYYLHTVTANGDATTTTFDPDSATDTVGWWKFEEGSGTTVADSSGNGNTGTASGGMTWETGKLGSYAGGFDGSDDYVTVTHDASLMPTGSISVACWVKTATTTNFSGLVDKYVGGGGNSGWVFDLFGGSQIHPRLGFEASGGFQSVAGTGAGASVNDDAWHHCAGTWDGTTGRIYIDGVLNNSAAMTGPILTNSVDVVLGGDAASTLRLNGDLDDVRVYNRALTAAEIASLYANTASYKFDTGGITFDGTGDSLTVTANAVFQSTQSDTTTWETWVRPTSFATSSGVFVMSSGTTYLDITINTSGEITAQGILSGSGDWAIAGGPSNALTVNEWNHLRLTRNSTTFELFINGTSVGTSTSTATYGGSGWTHTVGGNYAGNLLTGQIDEFLIIDGAAPSGAGTPTTAYTPATGFFYDDDFSEGSLNTDRWTETTASDTTPVIVAGELSCDAPNVASSFSAVNNNYGLTGEFTVSVDFNISQFVADVRNKAVGLGVPDTMGITAGDNYIAMVDSLGSASVASLYVWALGGEVYASSPNYAASGTFSITRNSSNNLIFKLDDTTIWTTVGTVTGTLYPTLWVRGDYDTAAAEFDNFTITIP